MLAAVHEGDGVVVREVPEPVAAADEVLIEVEACGLCGSDVQIINVPPGHPSSPPVVIGHEFVGWIRVAEPAVRDPAIGARRGRPGPEVRRLPLLPGRSAGELQQHRRSWRPSRWCACPLCDRPGPTSEEVPAELAARVEPLACVVNGANRTAKRSRRAGRGARVVVFGMNANARPEVRQIEIVEKGLAIFGSYISNFTFSAAIRLVERSWI